MKVSGFHWNEATKTWKSVAEVLAEGGSGIPFKRLGLPEGLNYQVGSQMYLLERVGLSAAGLVAAAKQLLGVD